MSEKLQKVLARSGVGSRREMETVISAGRVTVDGKVAHLGIGSMPINWSASMVIRSKSPPKKNKSAA